jgi:hypothetical protein
MLSLVQRSSLRQQYSLSERSRYNFVIGNLRYGASKGIQLDPLPTRRNQRVEDQAGDDPWRASKAAYLVAAKDALRRAKFLVEAGDDASLRYSALELRTGLECLVFENALRFSADLAATDFQTWHPGVLLERLLEIDPLAASTLTMSVQDPETGEWHTLGTDKRIGLSVLKKHYYALGNFLHAPTIEQIRRRPQFAKAKLLKRCLECIEIIEQVTEADLRLGSAEFFGHINFECVGCGTQLRRRLNALQMPQNRAPGTKASITLECPNCPASYDVRHLPDKGVGWRPQEWDATCPADGCEGVHRKWVREVASGMKSTCPACGEIFELRNARILASLSMLAAAERNKDEGD